VHDLYFTFRGNDEGAVGIMIWWTFETDSPEMWSAVTMAMSTSMAMANQSAVGQSSVAS
jgi:hypothetical protein